MEWRRNPPESQRPRRRYHRALMVAYFSQHRTVSDRSVLVAIAGELGIDTSEFDALLTERGREFERDVWKDYAEAIERGIHAVPTVVVDDTFIIGGAVDTNDYRQVIVARGG